MAEKETNYYRILGVSPEASDNEIRQAYLSLAKKIHPDHSSSSDGHQMAELNRIYKVLSNPVSRREYDDRFVPVKTLDFSKPPVQSRGAAPQPPPRYRPISPDMTSHRLKLAWQIALLIFLLCLGGFFAINILGNFLELPPWLARFQVM